MDQTWASSPHHALNPVQLTGLISSRSSLRRYMIMAWTMFPRRAACTSVFLVSTKSYRESRANGVTMTGVCSGSSLSSVTWVSLPQDLSCLVPVPQSILHMLSGGTARNEMHNHIALLLQLELSCFSIVCFICS